jgi:hypothetical protein
MPVVAAGPGLAPLLLLLLFPLLPALALEEVGTFPLYWKTFRRFGPPQYSEEFPWQNMLQPLTSGSVLVWSTAPFAMEVPQ